MFENKLTFQYEYIRDILSLSPNHRPTALRRTQEDTIDVQALYIPCFLTVLLRLSQDHPLPVAVTCPSGHSPGLSPGSAIKTKSPRFKLCLGWNHFFLTFKQGNNSLLHLFQNCCKSCCTRCQRFLGLYTSVRSRTPWANEPPTCPMRKWLGVSGERSSGFELT